MKAEIRFRLLLSFSLVCLLGLLLQSYFLWDLNQKLHQEQAQNLGIPSSIQERLKTALSPSTPTAMLNDPLSFGTSTQHGFGADPFARMRQMQQYMDSLFTPFTGAGVGAGFGSGAAVQSPQMTFRETEDEYQVLIQVPQHHELEVGTEIEANLLRVNGTLTQSLSSNANSLASNFVSRSQFSRSFDLAKPVDEFGLYTEMQEGGLLVGLPKK